MKNFLKLSPLLLLGATVTSDWLITFSSGDYSVVGDKMINLWSSFLNIIIWFLPYILVFGVVVGLGYFLFHKITGR